MMVSDAVAVTISSVRAPRKGAFRNSIRKDSEADVPGARMETPGTSGVWLGRRTHGKRHLACASRTFDFRRRVTFMKPPQSLSALSPVAVAFGFRCLQSVKGAPLGGIECLARRLGADWIDIEDEASGLGVGKSAPLSQL